jgi:hypothetical protein
VGELEAMLAWENQTAVAKKSQSINVVRVFQEAALEKGFKKSGRIHGGTRMPLDSVCPLGG